MKFVGQHAKQKEVIVIHLHNRVAIIDMNVDILGTDAAKIFELQGVGSWERA